MPHSTDYQTIESSMTIHFEADELDLWNVGVLAHKLHGVLNQVAITTCQSHDELLRLGGPASLKFIPQSTSREDNLVRARITGLRQGSLEMELVAAILVNALSHPGVITTLHDIFSHTIHALAAYAGKVPGVVGTWIRNDRGSELSNAFLRPTAARRRMRPKVEQFIKQLSEATNGGKLRLKTRHEEFEIEFYSNVSTGHPASTPPDSVEPL